MIKIDMATGSLSEEDTTTKPAAALSIKERLSQIVSLVEERGHEDEVRELLRNSSGLLHEACHQGSVTSVVILLDRGVPTSEWDDSFLLPLHIVARNNLIKIAKVLLEHSPEGVDRPSKFGETPLHFACMKGHGEMAELLVKYKGNVDRRDHCGNTTLHYAVASDDPKLIEWLLVDKNMHEQINARNTFRDTPLHRAAVLQCSNIIPVLFKYRAKLSTRDKHGFTAPDIAGLLYNNIKSVKLPNGKTENRPIFPSTLNKTLPSLPTNDVHSRSSSFSVSVNPIAFNQDGSTISLPTNAGRKKPSATQSRRPVNLTFSNGYGRQTSGISTGSSSVEGSRNSLYLRDKEQASRLSEVIDTNQSIEDVHKIVKDQTGYEPPIDMYFVGKVEPVILTSGSSHLESKDHDIKLQVNDKYWIHAAPNETLECRVTAGLHWSHAYPTGHVLVSPICFVSFKSSRSVPVTISLPHALFMTSESFYKRVVILTSPTGSRGQSLSPGTREFRHLSSLTSFTLEATHATFTTSVSHPTLFAVGLLVSPSTFNGNVSPTMLPIVPLRCCLYVACPSDLDQYLTNTDIWVYVGMGLKTVETAMQKHVVPHNFSLEEKRFILTSSVLSVDGELDGSSLGWQALRRGKGLFRYTQVTLSQDSVQLEMMSHHETYPSKEAFAIECHNPKVPLEFRVSVTSDFKELVNIVVVPYKPPKISAQFGMSQIGEVPDSPLGSSTESIPLKSSVV